MSQKWSCNPGALEEDGKLIFNKYISIVSLLIIFLSMLYLADGWIADGCLRENRIPVLMPASTVEENDLLPCLF